MPAPEPPARPARPEGFDPQRDVLLDDTARLRALAHPLRVRLLGLLRTYGSSTATALATRVGQSSGVTSYHLRQLEASGFVVDDVERGNRRERWWKAAHSTTWFDPADPGDPEVRALGEGYMRAVAGSYSERMARFLDGAASLRDEMGADWDDAWTMSDSMLALAPAEADHLLHEIHELVARYRRAEPGPLDEGLERVVVQWQVLPQVPDPLDDGRP